MSAWHEDFAKWKRRRGLAPSTKVFIITGLYPDVRTSLLARGWAENSEAESEFFDLKWCLRTRSIHTPRLIKGQQVNHFAGAGECLTTKYGLLASIKQARWHFDVSLDTFFPRTLNLSDAAEMVAFEVDFKWCAAASVLRRIVLDGGTSSRGVPSQQHVHLALLVCAQQLAYSRNIIDDNLRDGLLPQLPVLAATQWQTLLSCPCFTQCTKVPGAARPASASAGAVTPLPSALQRQVDVLLAQLKVLHCQSSIDGHGNIWILKPGGKSRGRGIFCTNSLDEIKDKVKSDATSGELMQMWVAQKYIEHPLIIRGRKFDIRQWVLVTSLAPLTVWFYDQCYLRFCAEDYSLTDITNVFCHLSNNCIARKSQVFQSADIAEGNMWPCSQFAAYLEAVYGRSDLWATRIKPQMQRIVQYSMACAAETLEGGCGSHELFGYDFVVDEALNVWLIEVNCSPSLEHSTPVTGRMVASMVDDLFKVVLDVPEHVRRSRHAPVPAPAASDSPAPAGSPAPAEGTVQAAADAAAEVGADAAAAAAASQPAEPPAAADQQPSSSLVAYQRLLAGADAGLWRLIVRGEALGECCGVHMLSNPLVLKGSPVALPRKQRVGPAAAAALATATALAAAGGFGDGPAVLSVPAETMRHVDRQLSKRNSVGQPGKRPSALL